MNHPGLKAKSHPCEEDEEGDSNELEYFNYNEVLIENYQSLDLTHPDRGDTSLVMTHFPNNYFSTSSSTYKSTRVVRIPRIYHTIEDSDIIPQFSSYFPGTEPAALHQDLGFDPVGVYDKNLFGVSSAPPVLRDVLEEQKYSEYISKINLYLYQAFRPYGKWAVFETLMDFISGNWYNRIAHSFLWPNHTSRTLDQLEVFISRINEELQASESGIKFLSPRKTGYTTLDIEIPKPTL